MRLRGARWVLLVVLLAALAALIALRSVGAAFSLRLAAQRKAMQPRVAAFEATRAERQRAPATLSLVETLRGMKPLAGGFRSFPLRRGPLSGEEKALLASHHADLNAVAFAANVADSGSVDFGKTNLLVETDDIAYLLLLEARQAAALHDSSRALRAAATSYNLLQLVRHDPLFVVSLRVERLEAIARVAAEEAFSCELISPESLVGLRQATLPSRWGGAIANCATCEASMSRSVFESFRLGNDVLSVGTDGSAVQSSYAVVSRLWGPLVDQDEAAYLELLGELVSSDEPCPKAAVVAALDRGLGGRHLAQVSRALFPSLRHAFTSLLRAQAGSNVVHAATIALGREAGQQLAKPGDPSIPDPFADGPVCVVRDATGSVSYSVGPDGVDERGRGDDVSVALPPLRAGAR